MPITNRELPAGTILTGTLKKTVFQAEVVETPEGIRYRVNGKEYKSPSAAGSAIMGGISCNGWRFWSVQGGEAPQTDAERLAGLAPYHALVAKAKRSKSDAAAEVLVEAPKMRKAAPPKRIKLIKSMPNAKAPEGMARWWCSSCMESFNHAGGETPEACQHGHPRYDFEDPTDATTEATDAS